MKVLILCMFLLLLSVNTSNASSTPDPTVEKGRINLSKWNFDKQGPVKLKGKWEFYWKEKIYPSEFRNQQKPKMTGYIKFPQRWNGHVVNGTKLNKLGFATYRVLIKLPEPDRQVGLKIPEFLTSFEIFINGSRLLRSGKAGIDSESSAPGGNNNYVSFIPNTKNIEIVVHAANFFLRAGGTIHPMVIGDHDDLSLQMSITNVVDAFVIGSILIMGFYHLVLYILRTKNKAPLVFAAFCLVIGIRSGFSGDGDFFYIMNRTMSWEWTKKWEYILFWVVIPTFAHFIYLLYPQENIKWVHRVVYSIAGVLTVITLFTKALFYSNLISIIQIAALISIIFIFVGVGRAIYKKRPGAIFILLGFLAIAATTTNDILMHNKVISSVPMAQFGIFLFIFAQSVLLSKLFSAAFKQTEVDEEKIRLMHAELVEKEKARTLFFHNTSHELRTPLNGIIGFVQLLILGRYGELGDKMRGQLVKVEHLANGLKNQVNTILDLAKSKRGELTVANSLFTVNGIFEQSKVLADGLSMQYAGSTYDCEKSWEDDEVINFIGDQEKILVVIRNLLGNAFKFKHLDKENHVIYSFKVEDNELVITVKDNGIGIASEDLSKIFQEFQQVEKVAGRSYEGTGLGLAMVRKVVEVMNGVVAVKSEVGAGSRFTVTIPSQDNVDVTTVSDSFTDKANAEFDEPIDEMNIDVPSAVPTGGAGDYADKGIEISAEKPYKILVVDDNEINREVISEVLVSHGYPVVEADGGAVALKIIKEDTPDLVLLDLMMPEVSGEDVLQEVRATEKLRDLPIILLTARASQDDKILGLNMGADDYLAKPIVPDEILLRVRNTLSRIDLAREKSQKAVMEKQNVIFGSLLALSSELQLIDDLDIFLKEVLSKLNDLFQDQKFALLIEDGRSDAINHIALYGVEDKDKEAIYKKHSFVVNEKSDPTDVTRENYIKHEVLGNETEKIQDLFDDNGTDEQWTMIGGEIDSDGERENKITHRLKLFMKGRALDDSSMNTIKVFIDQVTGASRNKLLTKKLDKLAHTDSLTGVYNRTFLLPALEDVIKKHSESENRINFSVVMCDINGLKEVNDEQGHDMGDKLICICSEILTNVCSGGDIVVRQGGDEFVVLCPASSSSRVEKLVDKIRDEQAKTTLKIDSEHGGDALQLGVHMSIGVASSENIEPDKVLKVADTKMYEDKEEWYKSNTKYRQRS